MAECFSRGDVDNAPHCALINNVIPEPSVGFRCVLNQNTPLTYTLTRKKMNKNKTPVCRIVQFLPDYAVED